MRILLTGPTGFIGANFLRQALDRGHAVAALLLPGETVPSDLQGRTGLTTILGTLAEPPWSEIEAFQPDTCVHTAWITAPGIYLESSENDRFLEWSVAFAERFFRMGGRYLMGLGSCAEYWPARRPLAETESSLNDSTRYARCKTALRVALEKMAASSGGGASWGRVFFLFGIGEHPGRLCSSLITRISRGEPVALKTPESTKDYIYIDDLIGAMLLVVENQARGTINLGTGRGITVRQIARIIANWMERPDLVTEAPQSAPDPLDYMVADAAKLRQLGWQEQVGFEPGLRRLCEQLSRRR